MKSIPNGIYLSQFLQSHKQKQSRHPTPQLGAGRAQSITPLSQKYLHRQPRRFVPVRQLHRKHPYPTAPPAPRYSPTAANQQAHRRQQRPPRLSWISSGRSRIPYQSRFSGWQALSRQAHKASHPRSRQTRTC